MSIAKLLLMLLVISCQKKPPVATPVEPISNVQQNSSPIFTTPSNPLAGITTITPAAARDYREWLYALAACSCEPELVKKELRTFATSKGVLPQILVPTVREEVRNNPALKILAVLPFGEIIQSIFASDTQVSGEISSTLKQRLSGALGVGGLALGIQTRLDHFLNFKNLPNQQADAFSVEDQALRWNLVWSFPALWENTFSLDGRDQTVQLLETVRTVSEWAYIIGIDSNGRAGAQGGLMRDAENPDFLVGPYDPSTATERTRFLSGSCKVSYSKSSAVTMATDITESWACTTNPPTLAEQALVATTAAKGFGRMRVDKRGKVPLVFNRPDTTNRLLPYRAHEIALSFLPGYKGLLTNYIITKDSNDILNQAYLRGGVPEPKPLADLRTIMRFSTSVSTWLEAVQNIDASGSSQSILPTLREIPAAMRPALQLASRDLISRYTGMIKWQDGREMLAILGDDGKMTNDVARAAQAIHTLAVTDQKNLPSPLLRNKVLALFSWFNAALIPQALQTTRSLQGEDALWTRILYRTIDAYSLPVHQTAWLAEARKQIGD